LYVLAKYSWGRFINRHPLNSLLAILIYANPTNDLDDDDMAGGVLGGLGTMEMRATTF
jgi:hypothetical protein